MHAPAIALLLSCCRLFLPIHALACCSGSPQPIAEYPVTEAGQLKYIVDVRSKLASALGKQNGGVLWWEGSESCWGCLFGSGYSPDERPRYVARPALVQGFR